MTKYFSKDTPLASLERMMMSVPGFQKRGGGMMVLCRFHYKKEDVDCAYCRSYMRHTCQESVCPYIPERLEAGTIGYQELAERCLRMAGHQKLWKRASSLSKGNTLPLALEPAHRHRLSEWPEAGTASICPQKLAAVYLLSSRIGLWRRVLPHVAVGTTIIEYIRNCLKRVRKKESAMLLASQNLEDFSQEGIRELTKPLFAIPPHQFLFNAGAVDKKFYMEALQLEESEYNLIRFPQRGVCLYRCGNERYLLEVHAPAYKEALFGKAGGR